MPFINDFVVKEHICNMKCEYCLTGTGVLQERETAKASGHSMHYAEGSDLQKTMDAVTEGIYDAFGISILKISGGEILLVKGIIDYLKKHAPRYKKIQVLTNGVLLSPGILARLKELDNICIQISIDYHTIEGNGYRTQTPEKLQRILDNLGHAVRSGIPVEINCVIHDKNAHLLTGFAEYLLQYDHKVILFPFPVRGKNKFDFYPHAGQLSGIEGLIDRYPDFQGILPPKAYLESLLRFLQNGKREVPCIFPKLAVGSFEDGNITPCANYWFTSLGNMMGENPRAVLEKVGADKIYRVLMQDRHRLAECNQCFTPWEVLNLYAMGALSIADLKKLPLYSFDGLESCLADFPAKGA